MSHPELHAEEILRLEFEYAAKTAEQAQDDRTSMVNLYLILVGGVGSLALALPELIGKTTPDLPRQVYGALFGALALTGFFVLMTIIRLRQAWQHSALAMNRIKDMYVAQFPSIADAFLWRTHTLPAPGKAWTITFSLAVLICILDSAALGVTVHFLEPASQQANYYAEFFAVINGFIWQMFFYFVQLPWYKK
jgi:hypothetical protein